MRVFPVLMFFVFYLTVNAFPSDRAESQKWFRDAKLGMFIHWGVYSALANGEWVMEIEGIPVEEYEKLPPKFNPVKFNAAEWVYLIKKAGMKYITITSKHHDGFCMFDTELTDYDIVDATPFKRDVMAELAVECKKQGIKLFFYYSHLDWHHPDYYPLGITGKYTGRKAAGDWSKYVEYYQGHLKELCSNYGEIGGIWFDGWWDKPDKAFRDKYKNLGGLKVDLNDSVDSDWDLQGDYNIIHSLQPNAMICNNHHVKPFPGEDYQAFERDLPGENVHGFSGAEISEIPLETCITLNDSWGYNERDINFKSLKEIIYYLAGAACRNANLLTNIGPMPTGEIQEEFRKNLIKLGKWLDTNGESIYGTRGGPFGHDKWGGSVWKDNKIFLHILKLKKKKLVLPEVSSEVSSVSLLDGRELEFSTGDGNITIIIPREFKNKLDTIVVLNLKSSGPYTLK